MTGKHSKAFIAVLAVVLAVAVFASGYLVAGWGGVDYSAPSPYRPPTSEGLGAVVAAPEAVAETTAPSTAEASSPSDRCSAQTAEAVRLAQAAVDDIGESARTARRDMEKYEAEANTAIMDKLGAAQQRSDFRVAWEEDNPDGPRFGYRDDPLFGTMPSFTWRLGSAPINARRRS